MKKSLKKLFAGILAGAMVISVTACTTGGQSQSDSTENVKPDPYTLSGVNVIENDCYMLLDFETYFECVQPVWASAFGKVTMITDSNYVTHGKQSVKLEITGTEYWTGPDVRPTIYLQTENQYFQKVDFSDCDYFAVDFYNALDYVNNVSFLIDNKEVYTIACEPGWNKVQIDVSGEGFSDVDLSVVSHFKFSFDRGEKHEQTQVFYMDNFRAHKKAE